jgi:hypothetical protein
LTQEIQENEMPNDENHNPDNQVKDDDSSKKITSGVKFRRYLIYYN